ncbi:MAG: hypothetical protein JWN04_2297 [Myxococcaceae bacterium]|nr:hypothetical protein [Myxococcaceae bacterium]
MNCRAWSWSFALGIVGLLTPLGAHADAMRCGRGLVKDDTPLAVVQSTCGAPSEAVHRVEHRAWPVVRKDGSAYVITEDVVVDQWTYDFGPNEWVYSLTFENGRMVAMIRGSWGKSR